MCTSQELRDRLLARMKNAAKHAVPATPSVPEERREIFPGKRYCGERGGVVIVIRCSRYRVMYQREGYCGVCEMSRREFDRKFTEVKS